MTEETIKNLIELGKIVAPSVILPILILWLTNRNTRKNRKLEQEFEIKKIEASKNIEDKFTVETQIKNHEIIVHSSLIKILFEVQKLHIALSGNCIEENCITDATKLFLKSFEKYQSVISDNQIFLSSKVTNLLYKFYNNLGQLMIELKNINEAKEYQCGIVPVHNISQILADSLIEIQIDFVSKREYLKAEFEQIQLTEFRQCCGNSPTQEQHILYSKLISKKNNLKNDIKDLPKVFETKFEIS